MSKKLVRISENDLVDLINNIVTEAVKEKKKNWIAEQATNKNEEVNVLEERIAKLENLISNAKITKKVASKK